MNNEIQLCEVRDVSPTVFAIFQASPWFVKGESHTTNELLMMHGHPRTILLARCGYNADILEHIEDYAHFAEASATATTRCGMYHDRTLLFNMQFYAARFARCFAQTTQRHPERERLQLEKRSIRFCRELFNPE